MKLVRGAGTYVEDVFFDYAITGHFRYASTTPER